MPKKRRHIAAAGLLAVFLFAGVAPMRSEASDDPSSVVHWNDVAIKTILADLSTRQASAAALYVAIVQAAVYNATMAIQKTHALYHSSLSAPSEASVDAAVAAAARDVLVQYFPSQGAHIDDTYYYPALAEIANGDEKEYGVSTGQAAAAEMIALRADDGRFASVSEPPLGSQPGEWRRAGASITPWVANVRPFLVNSPDQFRPDGPNALTSEEYTNQWNEVREYGAKNSTVRSEKQTNIARFWTENTVGQFNRAFGHLADERDLSSGEAARLFAMTALTGADGMITCWNTKFHYRFWRPISAIRLADTDGNPWTTADPSWEPLSTTANHPEYTSGHACLTGAVTRALEMFLGTEEINMTMTSAIDNPPPERGFDTVEALRTEVENARIYGGDHFRLGGRDGTQAGDHVAKFGLKRYFQPN
jgi:hypothetical protein